MKRFLLLLIAALGVVSLSAQQNNLSPMVKIRMIPTKGSWDYKIGEPIKMEVSVEKNELPLPQLAFYYEAGPELVAPTLKGEASTGKGSVVLDLGRMSEPGFFNLSVRVEVDGKSYTQWKTVAVDKERLQPTVHMPEDFEDYWKRQLDELGKIELKPEYRLLPERCTDKVDVYEISYQYTPTGGRMYGILCRPKAEGSYPAVLKVPGAGVRPYQGDVWLASQGYITLEVGIHGIPVTLDAKVYDALRNGALNCYQTMNIESRDNYYYNKVYKGCKRAVDFIYQLPCFNGKCAVTGGSQGGALTVVVAALDPRIVCASASYPALSDMTGYLYGRAGGWPHILKNPESNVFNRKEFIETLSYYDVVNFARLVKCPIQFVMGYNDKVCPPTSTFSVYNVVQAPKKVIIVQEIGHWLYSEQYARINEYLVQGLE